MQTNSSTEDLSQGGRKVALDVLAAADSAAIAASWDKWADKPAYDFIRAPETGLIMIRGRTGGGGAPFNLGEATVIRASVRLHSGEIGHGYCLGRDGDKARHIALFDALRQRDAAAVDQLVIAPLQQERVALDAKRRDETAATKVDFFTLVRGED